MLRTMEGLSIAEILCSVNMLRLTDTDARRTLGSPTAGAYAQSAGISGGSRMTWTRRRFLAAASASAVVAGGAPPPVAQGAKSITVSHSVSTFVYGQHLVAKEKK